MTILLVSVVLFLIACVLLAVVMSDGLLQGLARAVRGAALEPRQLLTVRKVGYVILVVYLFTGAFLWRQTFVDPSRQQLGVSEQSRGDVHLTGSLMRLGLGGFRGITTCYLWNLAMEKQKKNQLNELEVVVGWLTDLQPHFNTPWLFQAWNLAYNVSNKTDRISDKYFYISRGIRLLADGERQNHDDPDLRFELGTTYQHKICQSDETNYHRSLFQLSMIPPNERDPARFRPRKDKQEKVNMTEFTDFCERHPQLIRRLREGVHRDTLYEQHRLFTCPTPGAVVQFLADNYRVPSLYPEAKPTPEDAPWVKDKDPKPDKDTLERFPVLPPPRNYPPRSAQHLFLPHEGMRDGDLTDAWPYSGIDLDAWDAYTVSRGWYSYAQEPIPDAAETPGDTQPITDSIHQRIPRHMMTVIFRHYPARAQSYVAERLEEEGWFDGQGWSTKGAEWATQYVGGGREWAAEAWGEAARMWETHGRRNHLQLAPEEEKALTEKADRYRKARRLAAMAPLPPREDNADLKDGWRAGQFLSSYEAARAVTNYANNSNRAVMEQDPKIVRARKLFYQAESLASVGSTVEALRMYQDPDHDPQPVLHYQVVPDRNVVRAVTAWAGVPDPFPLLCARFDLDKPVLLSALDAWARVLEEHDAYRRDDLVEEESYETELSYLDVVNRALPGNELKCHLGAAASGIGTGGWINLAALLEARRPDRFPALAVKKGPFDRLDGSGEPWIRPYLMKSVLDRRRRYLPRRKDTEEGGTPQQQFKASEPQQLNLPPGATAPQSPSGPPKP